MTRRLVTQQRAKTGLLYAETKSVVLTQRRFCQHFNTRWAPVKNTIYRLYRQFETNEMPGQRYHSCNWDTSDVSASILRIKQLTLLLIQKPKHNWAKIPDFRIQICAKTVPVHGMRGLCSKPGIGNEMTDTGRKDRELHYSILITVGNKHDIYHLTLHIVESEKMVGIEDNRAFCVLDYHVHQSVIAVQRHFLTRFGGDPPSGPSISKWYSDFKTRGCICKRITSGCQSIMTLWTPQGNYEKETISPLTAVVAPTRENEIQEKILTGKWIIYDREFCRQVTIFMGHSTDSEVVSLLRDSYLGSNKALYGQT
ncbi:hypothetical protein C0J52_24202 [Blattella germanica]|nr:hypothetical protein C0J52_24202 [Blattella germanica]